MAGGGRWLCARSVRSVSHEWEVLCRQNSHFGLTTRLPWPTSGQCGYITPAAWGVPTASERGAESEVAHKCGQGGYITPAAWGVPTTSERGAESEVAHNWATTQARVAPRCCHPTVLCVSQAHPPCPSGLGPGLGRSFRPSNRWIFPDLDPLSSSAQLLSLALPLDTIRCNLLLPLPKRLLDGPTWLTRAPIIPLRTRLCL